MESHLGSGHGAGAYQEKKKARKKAKEGSTAPAVPAGAKFRAARNAAPAAPEPRRNSRKLGGEAATPGWEFDPNETIKAAGQ